MPEKRKTLEEWGAMPWYEQMFYGKPFQPPVSATPEWLTPRTREIMQRPEFQERLAGIEAGRALDMFAPAEPARAGMGIEIKEPMTYEEAREMQERLGAGYYIDYDEDIGGYRVERDPRFFEPTPPTAPISPWQEEQIRMAEEEARRTQEQQEWQRQWTQQEAERTQAWQREQLGWQEEQARMQQEQWQQQFGWQQEQFGMQQAEAERRYGAQLAAQPRSWLEYEAYKGQIPTVQPWMKPLAQEQYGWQVGQPIQQVQQAGEYAQLPQLARPSAQLFARMGPTAQAQMAGYRQARTGIRPEEQEFRRRATAPPGGRFGGLRWSR